MRRLPAETAGALQRYIIRFDSVVNSFYSGGLVGNGRLGASIYKEKGDTLCWEVGCTEVVDHRPVGEVNELLFNKARLPVGKFKMPVNTPKSEMVMDIYRAEVTGRSGTIAWRTVAPAAEDVILIEWEGAGSLPEVFFEPAVSRSPRSVFHPQRQSTPAGYRPNPPCELLQRGVYSSCLQPMLAGGAYATVWRTIKSGNKNRLWFTVVYSTTDPDPTTEGIARLERALGKSDRRLEQEHLAFWDAFYSRSFVTVGEEKYDAFYWRQLYKLGSATRPTGLPIDLMGPWYHDVTPWPAIWWNLNIQLTYSPLFTLNRADLVLPLCDMLDRNIENLSKNVPEWMTGAAAIGRASSYDCLREVGNEHGLLTWTLFYYWKYCLYAGDDDRLTGSLFPLLKRAVNYYRYLLREGDDGYLHMPVSHSPEYADAEDCNFELAILRWGCETLVGIDRGHAIGDPLLPEWERIIERLVPYPEDGDGFMIGRDVKLTTGHRHYSHLLMVYPLAHFVADTPEKEALVRRSILYWLGFQGGFYTGYTYSGASSMYTLLGDGENAYKNLSVVLDRYITPNTLYRESGPVFETPMSALASFSEMLLYSKRDEIYLFRAVPQHWPEVRFGQWQTACGVVVNAERKGGVTHRVELTHTRGGDCILVCDIPADRLTITGATADSLGEGRYRLSIPKGMTAILVRK